MTEDEDKRDPQKPGRRSTDELAAELDTHIAQNEKNLARWIRRGLIAFSIISVTNALALFGFGIVLNEQQKTAKQLKTLVQASEKTAKNIQSQRRDSIFNDCETTNSRNENTSKQLIALAAADEAERRTEAEKKEVRRRRDVTLSLIDALSPKQDCEYLVGVALGQISPTPTPTP